jgi:hypothetical protein
MFHGYPEITPSKLGAGVRGWKAVFHTRRQKIEDRGQWTVVSGQMSEDRGQRTVDSGQWTVVSG